MNFFPFQRQEKKIILEKIALHFSLYQSSQDIIKRIIAKYSSEVVKSFMKRKVVYFYVFGHHGEARELWGKKIAD